MNGSSRYTLRRAGDANCSSNGEGCRVGAAALGAREPEEETGPTGTTQISAIHLAVVSVRCRVIDSLTEPHARAAESSYRSPERRVPR